MSGRPKNEIMTPADMEKLATEMRVGNRLYSRTADGAEIVNALTSKLAVELATLPRKIDLRDTELVKEVVVSYVNACSKAGLLPSRIGLCRAMGISRQAVSVFMKVHSEEKTAEYLRIVFDSFAETLNSASLTGACHPIVGIFTLKAQEGWRDTVSLQTETVRDPTDERLTAAEIVERYRDFPLPD